MLLLPCVTDSAAIDDHHFRAFFNISLVKGFIFEDVLQLSKKGSFRNDFEILMLAGLAIRRTGTHGFKVLSSLFL